MKIRLVEIPVSGFSGDFLVEKSLLNERLAFEEGAFTIKKSTGTRNFHFNEFRNDASCHIDASLLNQTVYVKASYQIAVFSECVRCLEVAPIEIKGSVNFIFKPASEQTDDKAEEISLCYYQGEEIDCSEYLIESILLSIPYAPVCSSDCKGLCSNCGNDLNSNVCSCEGRTDQENPFSIFKGMKVTQ